MDFNIGADMKIAMVESRRMNVSMLLPEELLLF